MTKTISPKHSLVLDAYFEAGCKSKSEAMRKAGYSESTCIKQQSTVFDRPDVIADIERRRHEASQKHELKLDWVISRLMHIAEHGGKTADRKGALDSLARILGAFSDNVTIKGELSMVERLHAGRARAKQETGKRGQPISTFNREGNG